MTGVQTCALPIWTTYQSGSDYITFFNSTGGIAGFIYHSASTAVTFTQTSDKTLKTDLGAVTDVSYLDKTVVHDFEWTACGTKDRGVFAQDEYENNPRVVSKGDEERPWGVNYIGYIPDLIVYCQQLKAEIEALKAQLNK